MQCTAPVRSTVRVFASLMVMFAITAGLASAAEQRVQEVNYSSVEVHGIKVFYREAGPADGPPILLLHGFPASSHMFRDLMPKLADRYRVIAPDYAGYGQSDAPSAAQFNYPFERLTDVVESLTDKLGLARYSLYMLVIWGKNDPFFTVDGAQAYRRDVPKAAVHLFEGGHFLLQEHAEPVATLIRKFLGRHRTLSAADGQSGASSN
jgi:pimeloyl-ACP methyl ester carboxylesterase